MQRYDTYKDSGVKWLGEIPSHWEIISTKYIAKLYTGNSLNDASKEKYSLFSDDSYPYIASKDISLGTGTVDYDNGLYIPKDKSFFEIAPKNSFLLCIEGGSAGRKKAFLDRNCCFVNKLCCFDSALNPKYHYYFIQGDYFRTMFNCSLQGMIGGVSVSALKNFYTIVPPLEEQTAIANYLDTATAKIDAAIAQQQKMIDLLNERKQIIINRAVTKGLNPNAKMKDSGVEWIGVIPEKWEVCALKHYCLLTNGDRGPNYPSGEDIKDSGVLFATADNIHGLRIEVKDGTKYITKEKYNTLRGAKMRKGDIVFCLRGAGFGNCAINDLFDEGTIASSLVNITPLNIDCEFMNYVLHSAYIRMQEIFSSNGSCADNVSAQDLGDYLIVVPQKDDQKKIVNAITSTILPIDRLIKNTNNQISLLQERKQIIINEVVTGKVKVTN